MVLFSVVVFQSLEEPNPKVDEVVKPQVTTPVGCDPPKIKDEPSAIYLFQYEELPAA